MDNLQEGNQIYIAGRNPSCLTADVQDVTIGGDGGKG
jgi:hypothetical protein